MDYGQARCTGPRAMREAMHLRVLSHSPHDTLALGERLGHALQAGDLVCLYGELGSGKTVLTKGLAHGLGVPNAEGVRSPSFVLLHRYAGRVPVYHADLFRLDMPDDLEDIGLRELLGGEGVVIVEWADKLHALLPEERLDILLQHGDADTRLITVRPHGTRYTRLTELWRSQVPDRACPGRESPLTFAAQAGTGEG